MKPLICLLFLEQLTKTRGLKGLSHVTDPWPFLFHSYKLFKASSASSGAKSLPSYWYQDGKHVELKDNTLLGCLNIIRQDTTWKKKFLWNHLGFRLKTSLVSSFLHFLMFIFDPESSPELAKPLIFLPVLPPNINLSSSPG